MCVPQKPDSDKFVAEGLFRARLDAPSGGALGGVVLWGGPSEGLFRASVEAPSGGALGGVA